MAANLSVEIGLTGNAAQQAQQITQAFKDMGKAGDSAAQSVAQLQAAASKPMGTPQVNSFTQLVTSLERARQLYAEMANLGGQMGNVAGFRQAAVGAEEVSAALETALKIAGDMIREGKGMGDVFAMLNKQIAELPSGMERLGAEGRTAFDALRGMADQTVTQTKEWAVANKTVADSFNQIAQEAAKQQAQEQKKDAAAQKEAQVRATKQAAEAEREEALATKEAAAAHKEAAVAAKEEAEQTAKIKEGIMGFVGMTAGMAGFGVAMEAVEKPLSLLKEAMKAGGEEEIFALRLKDVSGDSGEAADQLEKLKDFVTGPLGGALQLPDVVQGVHNLELMTGQSKISEEQLASLGAAATANNQSFTQVANTYGRVVDSIRLGTPIRAQLLIQMQREGLISQATVAQVENAVKAHKNYKDILEMLDSGMAKNTELAKEQSETYDGLVQRVQKLIDTSVLAPVGGAIQSALKPVLGDIVGMLSSPEAKSAVQNFANELGQGLYQMFQNVKFMGVGDAFEQALSDAWDKFTPHIVNALKTAAIQFGNDLAAAFDRMQQKVTHQPIQQMTPEQQAAIDAMLRGGTVRVGGAPMISSKELDDFNSAVLQGYGIQLKNNDALSITVPEIRNLHDQAVFVATELIALGQSAMTAVDKLRAIGSIALSIADQVKRGGIAPSPGALAQAEYQRYLYGTGQAYPKPFVESKGGESGQIDQATKSLKEQEQALKQLEDLVSTMNTEWSIYGKQTKQVNDQEKEGIISVGTAQQKRIDLDKQINSQLSATITALQAQAAAIKAAYPEADITRFTNDIEKLRQEQDQVNDDLQKMADIPYWQNMQRGIQQAINAWGTMHTQIQNVSRDITNQIASGMGSALTVIETQTGSVGDAFKSMATSILDSLNKVIAQLLVTIMYEAILAMFQGSGWTGFINGLTGALGGAPRATLVSSPTAAVSSVPSVAAALPAQVPSGVTGVNAVSYGNAIAVGQQYGGLVHGPSGPDQVPSMLTSGEYVLTQRAVDKYGIAMIDAMNKGTWSRFASGGFVGSASSSNNIPPSQNINAATNTQNIAVVTNVTVPGTAGVSPSAAPVGGGGQGGLSPQDIAQLQQTFSNLIRDEIVRQKRPGGLLSRQQLTS